MHEPAHSTILDFYPDERAANLQAAEAQPAVLRPPASRSTRWIFWISSLIFFLADVRMGAFFYPALNRSVPLRDALLVTGTLLFVISSGCVRQFIFWRKIAASSRILSLSQLIILNLVGLFLGFLLFSIGRQEILARFGEFVWIAVCGAAFGAATGMPVAMLARPDGQAENKRRASAGE